ncbi:MAG: type II secretion system F family protein [Endomicrobiales bacterium]|nr:type II secretion system F family protein [Endomicrobiales bacterium]
MMVLIASVCAGIAVFSVLYTVLEFAGKVKFEKKFRDSTGGTAGIRAKGITGSLLFAAEKIGEKTKGVKHPKFEGMIAEIRNNLSILGGSYAKMDPYTFVGIQALSAVGVMIVCVLVLDIYNVFLVALLGFGGFFIPVGLNRDQVKSRHKAIFRQIPDILDMLTLMIEAGLDFTTALNKILEFEKGPLVDEFMTAQQEIRLGKSRAEAFENMMARVKYPPLNSVMNSIILAMKTGGSMAPTLRILSDQFRVERAQLAEKMASEAPIKLMGPLVILIFPTIFIVLFGPILLSFMGGG